LALAAIGLVGGCTGGGGTGGSEPTGTVAPDTSALKLVKPGQLTVGSDTTFPPMESMNGAVAEGFDVDLVTAMGKEMGVTVVFQTEAWDPLIPNLIAGGKFDMIASGMTITPERQAKVTFSTPYLDSNQSIVMRALPKMTYTGPKDLKGMKVGVQSGTTGETWATENLKPTGSTIVPFPNTTDAFTALKAKNVDAVVNDLPVSLYIIKQDKTNSLAVMKEIPTGEQYGFAVNKENTALVAALNDALAKVKASGEYQKIYDKWFPKATGM
jgi:polar amino acid transport system substrate-binding protein